MKYVYVVNFRVFDKPATEIIISDDKPRLRREIEMEVKAKCFDSAVEFKITEYEVEVKKEQEI